MPQFVNTVGLLLGAIACISAFPAAVPTPTTAPDLQKRAACTFSGATGAAAAIKSKAACATIVLSSVAVPSGVTLDLSGLSSGTNVIFEGTTTFGYEEWSGPLIQIGGANIAVSGAAGHKIDGNGSRWWDKLGSNVTPGHGKVKPKFIALHSLTGASTVDNLNIFNSPVQVFSIDNADGLTITKANIDNSAGDAGQLAHNTDAFDIGSSNNVHIVSPTVHNQDDCLAVNSGTTITWTGGTCTGGHGLSIGSVGGRTDNTVNGVTIKSVAVTNSANGVRVKTVSGATGSVKGVSFESISLSGITKYGIVIEQDYQNGSPTGTPTSGVPITGLTVSGVTGTVDPSATNIYILCASCSGWTWTGNKVTGGITNTNACKGVPAGASC